MGRFIWSVLAGFAIGTPAIPVGLSLSLPGPVALFAVLLGSGCCVVFAVFAMGRARSLWQSWRARRKSPSAVGASDGATPVRTAVSDRLAGTTGRRARRIFERYGVVGFGIVGPVLFGTWGSSLLGAALGIPRWRLIRWLMAGVTLWCTVMLFASDAAFDAFEIG
ncbi:hypothetical protein ACFWIA_01460 [Streptomyces sp. NPDC127068]|uniref:hypothetical protein n=1 Tax=Streptomyces sp. NPDC127068 TaxID=3347127 RepID=UPI00365EDD26